MCDVNQLECLRYGVEALSSTVEIDVDPKLLTLEQRNFVVDNLYEGVRYPRNRELNICPPTYAGLLASIDYGVACCRREEHRSMYVALTPTAAIVKEYAELRTKLTKAAISVGATI